MFKSITSRTAVWLLFVLAVFALWTSSAVAGVMLDYDTYVSPWPSAVPSTLNGYDGVTKHPDARYSQPWGYVTYEIGGGQVPDGTQLWVVASTDKQVVGELDMDAPGSYNFSSWGATYGIYGDKTATGGVDEGATIGESLIVLAEIGGKYYQGYFSSGPLASGYDLTTEECDIKVTDTIMPEPATLALMAAGGAATVLLRRRRER